MTIQALPDDAYFPVFPRFTDRATPAPRLAPTAFPFGNFLILSAIKLNLLSPLWIACMLNILVVDDAKEDLLLTKRVFQKCGILNPVHLIDNGEACMRVFEPGTAEQDPYLVFLDVSMPVSGLKILGALRDKPLFADSILVMLSGITDVKQIQQSYQLGARSFLIKPLKAEDLQEVLASLQTRIQVEESPTGKVLHWVSTPPERRSSDTEFIRRPATDNPTVSA